MSKKTADKKCPLLEARGVSPKELPTMVSAFDDSWLKICISECPIDACIFFDILTEEEMEKLEGVANA